MSVISESLDLVGEALYSDVNPLSLVERWAEPHRSYHSLDHVIQVLNDIETMVNRFGLSKSERLELHLMGWYHDIVYVPGSKTNEDDSALLALSEIRFDGLSKRVCRGIYRTIHHVKPASFLEACLIDADLAGLGRDDYYDNSFKVKAEYPGISDFDWMVGRFKFLDTFLARPTIYYTAFGGELEAAARKNMEAERDALEGRISVRTQV